MLSLEKSIGDKDKRGARAAAKDSLDAKIKSVLVRRQTPAQVVKLRSAL